MKVNDIHEIIPGVETMDINRTRLPFLTIIAKPRDFKSRVLYIELYSTDDKNTVLTGLRAIISSKVIATTSPSSTAPSIATAGTGSAQPAALSPLAVSSPDHQAAASSLSSPTSSSTGGHRPEKASPTTDAGAHTSAQLKEQLSHLKSEHDLAVQQVKLLTNDLIERDSQVFYIRLPTAGHTLLSISIHVTIIVHQFLVLLFLILHQLH